MKKYFLIMFSILLFVFCIDNVVARDVSSCSNLTEKNECISSREKD